MNGTELIDDIKLGISKRKWTREEFRNGIMDFEEKLLQVPGVLIGHEMDESMCPLTHKFIDGLYVREIFMPKGIILTSRLHKTNHPYFILRGDVSVATEEGIVRLVAPYSGITKAGTKRLLFTHADTVWVTIHATNLTDERQVVAEITSPTYEDIPEVASEKVESIT